jgi:tetratricopeptide (TPR) repeat protein
MPEVIQEKPNRMPQRLAVAGALALLLLVGGGVVWLKVTSAQKSAFEAAKKSAVDRDKHADYLGEAQTLQAYLDSKPPKKYADQLYITTATAYLNGKSYDQAITYYVKADKINAENHSKATNGLALAYEYKGDKAKAIEYYKQLIDLAQKNKTSSTKMEVENLQAEIARLQEGTK